MVAYIFSLTFFCFYFLVLILKMAKIIVFIHSLCSYNREMKMWNDKKWRPQRRKMKETKCENENKNYNKSNNNNNNNIHTIIKNNKRTNSKEYSFFFVCFIPFCKWKDNWNSDDEETNIEYLKWCVPM